MAPVRASRNEDAFPRVAPVGGPEDPAFLTRHPVLPERRDVHDVRIRRVDADLGDPVRVAEADVLPGRARVAAPVDAVARQDVAANARLAGADEDEVGVGFGHRHRADRRRRDLEVGDGEPVLAAVGGLPEPAARGAEVGLLRAALDAGGGDRAAAAVRAEVAPGVAGEEGGVEGDLLGGEGRAHEQGRDELDRDCEMFHECSPGGAVRGGGSQPTGRLEAGTSDAGARNRPRGAAPTPSRPR